MAFSLFLLVALLSSVHTDARDSQFFNKIPSTTNDVVVPITKEALNTQQEPNFIPEKENGYGLYGHESGQNPPSTTTAAAATPLNAEFKQPAHKYLPKNYNPVAYVTQPEGGDDSVNFSDERGFSTNAIDDNKYNNGQNFYDNRWEKDETEFRNYPTTTTNKGNNGNYYYSGGSSFNSEPQGVSDTRYGGGVARNGGSDDFQPQGLSDTRYRGGATRSGGASGFQPQGMSDTRFMENGRYFYDVNAEKYSNNHPYESLRGVRTSNEYNKNFYGNAENNVYENNKRENSIGGYQNQEEFQDEESLP
ncbi:hypothetical protein ACS0TY_031366 [Phlomoides rotata]